MLQPAIPRQPGLPLVGNLLGFKYNRLGLFLQINQELGDIGEFRIGPRRVVMLNSPEYVRGVLVDSADHMQRVPRLHATLSPFLGNGLLTSNNEVHRRQRKLIVPAFQHRHVVSYADIITRYAEDIQRSWPDGAVVDVAHEMMRMTLRIVGQTLFGADVIDEAEAIGEAITIAMQHVVRNSTGLTYVPYHWPTSRNRYFWKAVRRLDATISHLIQERRTTDIGRNDLLSLLLQARDEDDGSFMTDQQVRDEIVTFLFAGHETVANALAWTWYLLAQHSDVYTRVREEVDSVLDGHTPTTADLPRLPYTLQVFKESMRLYPPVYIIPRSIIRPIQVGPYTLESGIDVGVSPYVLHRRPNTFPDPDRFDPDRFTPESEQHLPRYAYLPFGAGPHMCVGYRFAMMEGHLVLATLVQHIILELVPDQRIEPEPLITLRPKDGVNMVVRRRRIPLSPA